MLWKKNKRMNPSTLPRSTLYFHRGLEIETQERPSRDQGLASFFPLYHFPSVIWSQGLEYLRYTRDELYLYGDTVKELTKQLWREAIAPFRTT